MGEWAEILVLALTGMLALPTIGQEGGKNTCITSANMYGRIKTGMSIENTVPREAAFYLWPQWPLLLFFSLQILK